MGNYQWSRRSIPKRMLTIFELGRLLGLGRHQVLRRLKSSGLPFRTYIRRWTDPSTGKRYVRRATGIPQQTAGELIKHDIVSELGKGWKSLAKAIKMKNPAPPKHFEDLIQSIRDIGTGRPLPQHLRDFSPKTAYYSGASTFGKTLRHAQKIKLRTPKITIRAPKTPKAFAK